MGCLFWLKDNCIAWESHGLCVLFHENLYLRKIRTRVWKRIVGLPQPLSSRFEVTKQCLQRSLEGRGILLKRKLICLCNCHSPDMYLWRGGHHYYCIHPGHLWISTRGESKHYLCRKVLHLWYIKFSAWLERNNFAKETTSLHAFPSAAVWSRRWCSAKSTIPSATIFPLLILNNMTTRLFLFCSFKIPQSTKALKYWPLRRLCYVAMMEKKKQCPEWHNGLC